MDLNKAILYGQLVNAAYASSPSDLANRTGQVVNAGLGANNTAFDVISTVFANDLTTDRSRQRGQKVFIGLVLQSAGGDAVVAIRGTEGILEWIQDAKFGAVKCPFLAGAGDTEDGFTAVYNSLTTATAAGSSSLSKALAGLPWKTAVTSLTICGHSLGGALATLLALDVAANTAFNNVTVYTYASPRIGDAVFANKYKMIVPNTYRIANRYDIVPKLPPPPLYEHVLGFFEVSSVAPSIPPKFLIKPDASCEHLLNSYLYLLSLSTGQSVLPLDSKCVLADQPSEADLTETVEPDTLQPSEPRIRDPMRPSQWIDLITFNRFSPDARTTLARATQLCRAYNKKRIQIEHLLLALSERPQGQFRNLLTERQLDLLSILVPGLGSSEVPRTSDRPDEISRFPALSPNARSALSSARDKADADGRETIEESYLLFGVLSASENASVEKLGTHGITPDAVELSPPTSAGSASENVLAGYQSDSPSGIDLLDINKEVNALASVLAAKDVEPPLSLGLFGDWGTGKSFFMHQLEHRINELQEDAKKAAGETAYCQDIVQISFNAWNYIDSNLWASLTAEVFEHLAAAIAKGRGSDSPDERALILAAASSSQTVLAEAERKRGEAEEELKKTEQRLAVLKKNEADIEASLDSGELLRHAVRFALQSDRVQEFVGDAARSLHVPELEATSREIQDEILDLKGTLDTLVFTLKNDQRLWIWGVALLVATAVGWLIHWLLIRTSLNLISVRLLSFLAAIPAFLAPFLKASRKVLSLVQRANKSKQELIEAEKKKRADELTREHSRVRQNVEVARKAVEDASSKIKALNDQLERMRADRRMADYIRQRHESSDYTQHLGIISRVRADFWHLSTLLRDVKEQGKQEGSEARIKERQAEKDLERKSDGKLPLFPRIDRIVLYIDDLDRCPEKNVVEVLQAVHLLLAFPLFVVVVGVDARWLLHSLQECSRAFQADGSEDHMQQSFEEKSPWRSTPLNYLEKIFQIPFSLRPINKEGFGKLVDTFARPPEKHEGAGGAKSSPQSPDTIVAARDEERTTDAPALTSALPSNSATKPLESQQPQALAQPPLIDRNPDHLQISDWERAFMKELHEFIHSPRSGKRFINIYRLLRASVGDDERAAFTRNKAGGVYQTAMLLLAIQTGYPAQATEIFRILIEEEPRKSWWEFAGSLKARILLNSPPTPDRDPKQLSKRTQSSLSPDPIARPNTPMEVSAADRSSWVEFFEKLDRLKDHFSDRSCEQFKKWALRVARYSFQAGHVLSYLQE